MSFERFAVSQTEIEDSPRNQVVRSDLLSELQSTHRWDVLVVGGGIHGASFARLAAFNGLKTLLIEKSDFASATSSRSSKMAHGGLRYLEMFDFQQVSEGVKSREELYSVAPHLVKPWDFFIPIEESTHWLKFKLGLGLTLYDWFVPKNSRKHRWVDKESLGEIGIEHFGSRKLQGGYLYSDGIMNDTRLVMDTLSAARQEGATCLNYVEFSSFSCKQDYVDVGCFDVLTKKQYSFHVGVVVNCTGPWVAEAGRVSPSPAMSKRIRYSQGSHLLFRFPWKGPARFLPLDEPGRYYFVWPHFAGTLVGTTEREVDQLVSDPMPTVDEVNEILNRLRRDLPDIEFTRENLHYAFAGIRTLPLRPSSKPGVARLSRKHIWVVRDQVLNLIGGKYTSAAWTAYEGIRHVFKLSKLNRVPTPTSGRKLPGAGLLEESISEFFARARTDGVSDTAARSVVARLGSQVRHLVSRNDILEEIGAGLLRQEIEFSLDFEQAECREDIMRRRVLCELESGHGKEALDRICEILKERRPHLDVDSQRAAYLARLEKLHAILRGELQGDSL